MHIRKLARKAVLSAAPKQKGLGFRVFCLNVDAALLFAAVRMMRIGATITVRV